MTGSDVIVIGGGMAGVSLAAELSRAMSVTLLEAEAMPGYHATGRSAAVFVPNYGNAPIQALTRASRDHFDNPDPDLWPAPLFKHRGLLRIVRADGQEDYRNLTANAAGVETVPVAEACRLFPVLKSDRFVEASFERDVHDIDVDALLQGYLRKARGNRARIATRQRVVAIDRQAGDWRVRTHNDSYAASLLVNAAGAWADDIAALAGLPPLGMMPRRRSVAVLPLPKALASQTGMPFVVPFPLGWYAKPEAGRLLVSAGEEDPVEPGDAYADDMVLAEGLDRFSQDTIVEITRLESSWAGLRTFSPDGNPVIGRDPLNEGFYWFAGQGGFGIQTAPAMATLGAASIRDNHPVPDEVAASRVAASISKRRFRGFEGLEKAD
jgi:D-arginine dehydrogenase